MKSNHESAKPFQESCTVLIQESWNMFQQSLIPSGKQRFEFGGSENPSGIWIVCEGLLVTALLVNRSWLYTLKFDVECQIWGWTAKFDATTKFDYQRQILAWQIRPTTDLDVWPNYPQSILIINRLFRKDTLAGFIWYCKFHNWVNFL